MLEAFKIKLENTFEIFKGPEFNENFKQFIESKADKLFSSDEQVPDLSIDILTNPFEVTRILKDLRSKGAPGLDQITNKSLKELPPSFVVHLTNIINGSLKLAYVPAHWKRAVVTLIPKPANGKRTLNDFRAISFLLVIAKLCERIIGARFDKWILGNSLICPF